MIGRALRILFLGLMAAFLALPIVVVCAVSLNDKRRLAFPPEDPTFKWFVHFFENPQWINALQNSLMVGFAAAAVATALALPLAYALWRHDGRYIRLLASLPVLAFMMPPVIMAIGFLLFWARIGYVGQLANTILSHGVLLSALPLVTTSVGLRAIDRALLDAAATMGARPDAVFRTVILPLILPYVVSGYCFALVLSLNEYIVAYMVAGFSVETLPIKMLNSLRGGYTPAMSVGSVLFLAAGLLVFSLIARFGNLPRLLGADLPER
jgi:putative spermidine/putrescine transport system permease protein